MAESGKMDRWLGIAARGALLIVLAIVVGCGDGVQREEGLYVPDDPEGGPSAAAVRALPEEPRTVVDLLPATGSRGLVLNNCATCHAIACAVIGQRDQERWAAVEASHAGYIPGLSIEDRGKIFDYLARHFNDTLPEPRVPPELLEGGCPTL